MCVPGALSDERCLDDLFAVVDAALAAAVSGFGKEVELLARRGARLVFVRVVEILVDVTLAGRVAREVEAVRKFDEQFVRHAEAYERRVFRRPQRAHVAVQEGGLEVAHKALRREQRAPQCVSVGSRVESL